MSAAHDNPSSRRVHAPAKVNLALAVGAPEPDGYHPLASWMIALAFGDTLTLQRTQDHTDFDLRFTEDAPRPCTVDWPIEKDLAWRAHQCLQETTGRALPVHATLDKRIPPGAGLGGGSSDAAAMLVGLNGLFNLSLPTQALCEAAATLGSDVAFLVGALIGDPSALVTGRGETREPAPLHTPLDLTLVFPPITCPTGEVYKAFDQHLHDAQQGAQRVQPDRIRAMIAAQPPADAQLFNDLAEPACRVRPQLATSREQVRTAIGRPVHITGSGAAMFVLAKNTDDASHLAQRITAQTNLSAVATRTL